MQGALDNEGAEARGLAVRASVAPGGRRPLWATLASAPAGLQNRKRPEWGGVLVQAGPPVAHDVGRIGFAESHAL